MRGASGRSRVSPDASTAPSMRARSPASRSRRRMPPEHAGSRVPERCGHGVPPSALRRIAPAASPSPRKSARRTAGDAPTWR
jgi:hypothetical protein